MNKANATTINIIEVFHGESSGLTFSKNPVL